MAFTKDSRIKSGIKWAAGPAIGAATGAGAYSVIGGVGIAAGGAAIGLTAAPFIAIGAGAGLALVGAAEIGKQLERLRQCASTALA